MPDEKSETTVSSEESDEVPVTIEENSNDSESVQESEDKEKIIEQLQSELDTEKQRAVDYENKLKYVLADFQNLEKKTHSEIEKGIQNGVDKLMLDFLQIYDDFVRAKTSYEKSNVDTTGLDSILKNMDALLKKYNIQPIDALGEIFDPNLHDAISVKIDPSLDEGTITQEIRKGYISQNRVIRPTLVEISKKS
ncbi:MAG: nucleotide exchange factor GrpE [Nitrosopumilaceae archaeon]|nr:nucleotide exchange factor GrpE [Nitrosopumilaceae archaeon]